MTVTRKRGYPEENENRGEDNSDNRNAEESSVLEKQSVSVVSVDLVF